MSSIGHMFELLFADFGPAGYALLLLVALVSMWLGFRYSRPARVERDVEADGERPER